MNEAKSHQIKMQDATETDVEPSKMPRIRFNPEINLGHILQIFALTGAVITGYVSLQRDMASMRAEYQVVMAGFESRLTVAEHAIAERRQEDREFATEMRAALVISKRDLIIYSFSLPSARRRDDSRVALGDRFLAIRLQLNVKQSIHVCGACSAATGNADRTAKERNKTRCRSCAA